MSFFRSLFGRPKPVAPAPVVQTPAERDEEIQKKIASLRAQVATLTAQAQAAVAAGQRNAAVAMLKRRKLLEGEIATLEASSLRLVEQRIGLDTQRMHVDTLNVMREANRRVPRLSADEAAAVLDETEDRLQDVEELTGLFSRPLGREINVDDELAELEERHVPVAAIPKPLVFPSVPLPVHPQFQRQQTMTEQLAALEAM
jgi:hypothetical protein